MTLETRFGSVLPAILLLCAAPWAQAQSPEARHPAGGKTLDDARILYVTHVANKGEIEQGKLATQRSKDERVRRFAAMMVSHHTAADNKGATVAKKEKLELEPSAVAEQLQQQGSEDLQRLRSASDSGFDKAYIDAQVRNHQKVLSLIDDQLMPGARDPDVQDLLRDIRPTVESHLGAAQNLQKSLEK